MIKKWIDESMEDHGSCTIGLSGGSTPGPVYESLAKDPDIDWSKIAIFLVDDRFVPADDNDSNQKLIHDTILVHTNPKTIFPDTALPIDQCVSEYEDRLRTIFDNQSPDIVILGMGEDGHTASLFPNDEAAIDEKDRWVLRTKAPKQFAVEDRVTITLPLINSADHRLLLISGQKKIDAVKKMDSLGSPLQHIRYDWIAAA